MTVTLSVLLNNTHRTIGAVGFWQKRSDMKRKHLIIFCSKTTGTVKVERMSSLCHVVEMKPSDYISLRFWTQK